MLQFIEDIKSQKRPVVIFGAGIVGEVLFWACQHFKLEVHSFCDNNVNKTKSTLCGIDVILTSELSAKHNNPIILISAADIQDVVLQLQELGYEEWYSCASFLRAFDVFQYKFSAPSDFADYAVATAILCHDSYLTPDKLFLRSVDIVITERCSLKCRHCSNLMQYYKHPKDCSMEEVLRDINAFCSVVDEVNEFRLIGGEPFMNKDFHVILDRLVNEAKAKKVVIYTNGTIIPQTHQLESLKDKKVLVIITDYGELSRNLQKLLDVLKVNTINFYLHKVEGWTDCASIVKHARALVQQKELFRKCCAKNTTTLLGGKLYRCPFAANIHRLGAVLNCKHDYIDFFKEPQALEFMKKSIKEYLLQKEFLEICDYCDGRSFGDAEIAPAAQIKQPLVCDEIETF